MRRRDTFRKEEPFQSSSLLLLPLRANRICSESMDTRINHEPSCSLVGIYFYVINLNYSGFVTPFVQLMNTFAILLHFWLLFEQFGIVWHF